MILLTDVLAFLTAAFYGAAITAEIAGSNPVDYMDAEPWAVSVGTALAAAVGLLGWSVTFHPVLALLSGGAVGVTVINELARRDPKEFMDDPTPRRMATVALFAGAATTALWFVM